MALDSRRLCALSHLLFWGTSSLNAEYNLRMTEYPMSVLRLRRQSRAGVPSRQVETRKWFAISMQVVGGFCE
jgi:hypothetical protein